MKKVLVVLIAGLFVAAGFIMQARADDDFCCPAMDWGMCENMMGLMQQGMNKEMDMGDMFKHKVDFIMENSAELGLSDDQTQKIKALKIDTEKNTIKSDADLKMAVLDIKAALGKDEMDINSLNALIDRKYSIKSQGAKSLVSAYADLKKILSKDQMKKMNDFWKSDKMQCSKAMMKGAKGHERMMKMQ